MDLSGYNSVGSMETSVLVTSRTAESQLIVAAELSTSHCLQTARNVHKRMLHHTSQAVSVCPLLLFIVPTPWTEF